MKKKSTMKYLVSGVWTTKEPKDFSRVEGVQQYTYMTKKDWAKLKKITFKKV